MRPGIENFNLTVLTRVRYDTCMSLSSDVTLPKDYEPIFPASCVVCQSDEPVTKVKILAQGINGCLVYLMPLLIFLGWRSIGVPVCSSCKPKFHLQRWGRDALMAVLVILIFMVVGPRFSDLSGIIKKVTVAAVVLFAMIPYVIFEIFVPRCFDVTVHNNSIDYEFASEQYAREFQLLNLGHVEKTTLS